MEVINIQKSYGKKKVLKGLSFSVEKGKCTGIIGANGCGKSTLFKILSGVEKADEGSILIHGKPVSKSGRELAEYVGYIPQENAFMSDLSVRDNLKLYAALSKRKADDGYMEELCERFSVKEFEKERISRLSGGMKKRVSIICALLHKPELLVMDEPSTALDLVFKEELKNCILDFTKTGGSVLLSSHDRGEILQCDRLFAIKNGVLEAVETSLSIEAMIDKYMK